MINENNSCNPSRAAPSRAHVRSCTMNNDARECGGNISFTERSPANRQCSAASARNVEQSGPVNLASLTDLRSPTRYDGINCRVDICVNDHSLMTTHVRRPDSADMSSVVMMGILPPPPSEFLDDYPRSTIYCNGTQLNDDFSLSAEPPSPDDTLWQPRFAFTQQKSEEQPRCTCGLDQFVDVHDYHCVSVL
jgi:hypothetical protein